MRSKPTCRLVSLNGGVDSHVGVEPLAGPGKAAQIAREMANGNDLFAKHDAEQTHKGNSGAGGRTLRRA